MMTAQVTSDALAAKFVEVMQQWADDASVDYLTRSDLAEIDRRNSLPEYAGFCASHDFCDPNQAMIDALDSFGLQFDPSDEVVGKLIDDAWQKSKSAGFAAEWPA